MNTELYNQAKQAAEEIIEAAKLKSGEKTKITT